MRNKQKIIIISMVAVLVIAAGIYFWFWPKNRQIPSVLPPQIKESYVPTLGDKIFQKTQKSLQNQMPEINTFKKQKNPLDTIYKNPFE